MARLFDITILGRYIYNLNVLLGRKEPLLQP